MAQASPRDLLQLLANPTNRAILSVLSLEPQYPRRLAEVVGLTEDEASKRLRLFEKNGLAEGSWANVGKNVRLYRLATKQFTVHVDAKGVLIEGLKGAAAPVQVGSAAERAPATERFQGRDTELADLEALLTQRKGVCIAGIGGAGKTAIAARLSQRLGRPVLWHTLSSSESAPLLLGRLAATQRVNDEGERAQRLLELRAADDEALLRDTFLESLNATRTLVVLDRFEVAGESAAEEVTQWTRNLSDARLLITSRTYPQGLPRDQVASFRLSGLSRTDAQALLARLGSQVGTEAFTEIYDRTHGHPLSLVLIAQVQPEGREARVDRLLQESGIRDFFVDDVLPQLTPGERELLFALSVLRLPFTAEEAEAVSNDRYARHTLLKLEARGLVSRAGDAFLLHDLLRGFAQEAAPQPKASHARAAKVLAASGEAVKILDAIHHHLEAGAVTEAAKFVREEATTRKYRFIDLGHSERYRVVLERLAAQEKLEPRGRAACYLELGVLDTLEGEADRAKERLALVESTLGATLGDVRWPLLMARARLQRVLGTDEDASQTYQTAEKEAARAKDEGRQLEALVERGFLEEERNDHVAFEVFEKAIRLGRKTGNVLLLSLAYSGAARIGMRQGDDRHRAWADEGLRLARMVGYLRGEVSVYMTLTTYAIMTGETTTGLEYSDRYLAVARRLGDPWLKACAINDKALFLVATKMYEQALALAHEASDLARTIRSPFYQCGAGVAGAEALMGLGRHEEAVKWYERALSLNVTAWPAMAERGWRSYAVALRNLGREGDARKADAKARGFSRKPAPGDVSREWARLPPPPAGNKSAKRSKPTRETSRGPPR